MALSPRQPTGALTPRRQPTVVDLSAHVGKGNNNDEDEDDNSMGSEIIPKLSDTDEDEDNESAAKEASNGPTAGRKAAAAATVPLDLTCV